MLADGRLHEHISIAALWTPALRLSLEPEYRTSTTNKALVQTDLNCVLPSTRGPVKRHAVNRVLGPEVQFHRTTTLPGQEEIVRRAPMQDRSLFGK